MVGGISGVCLGANFMWVNFSQDKCVVGYAWGNVQSISGSQCKITSVYIKQLSFEPPPQVITQTHTDRLPLLTG